jgi:hypothetical protein
MSTLSGSAKAGSESGLKVRLYAILSPVVTVLMQRSNNCAQPKKSGGDGCSRRRFPACINPKLALQAARRSRVGSGGLAILRQRQCTTRSPRGADTT